MGCLQVFNYITKNTKWQKVIKLFCSFSIVFGLAITYFGMNDFTSFWTGFLVSLISSLIFSIGYGFNTKFRCAVAVCFVECFGGFGLLMLFLTFSWFSISESLDGMVINLYCLIEGPEQSNNSTEFKSAVSSLGSAASVIHYTIAVPFVFLFAHSFIYVCTYAQKVPRRTERSKESMHGAILAILGQIKGLLVGAFLALKLSLIVFQHLTYLVLQGHEKRVPIDSLRTSIYFVSVAVLFVVSPFSDKIMKGRHAVVRSYFKTTGSTMAAIKVGNILWKKKEDRVTFEGLKGNQDVQGGNSNKKLTKLTYADNTENETGNKPGSILAQENAEVREESVQDNESLYEEPRDLRDGVPKRFAYMLEN